MIINETLREKARHISLLLTDCDGVLTDGGVYYSDQGEVLKRFSLRDGMGVERLRDLAHVEVGIITGEHSASVQRRAEKLRISELHLGVKSKIAIFEHILTGHHLKPCQAAYIGDDTNDLALLQAVGLSACPADAFSLVAQLADYVCHSPGGHGAFREFAELIIAAKSGAEAFQNS
jgi:3-deoxy-D-manno-octulosonate 8-phosphate phosphatase (KDO 8-P phosphatase)